MNDLISVIIPVYNQQEYIEECIHSVSAQSLSNLEILIIDDGSTDRTAEICRKFASEDPRIRLLRGEHGGVSAARNMGIEAASGIYLFFLDGDDVIHPLLLETLLKGMESTGAQIAGTHCVPVMEASWYKVKDTIAQDSARCKTTYQTHPETLDTFFHSVTPINLIGGVMIRRDLVDQTRFQKDLFIGEDYYFVYQNLVKGAASVFLESKWYYYRIHQSNSSWNYGYPGFWTRFIRRVRVWENEEALGRTEYANCQKRDAFDVFLRCLLNNRPYSEDGRKIRAAARQYRKQLFPALTAVSKLRFFGAVYAPFLYSLLVRIERKIRKLLRR